MSCKPVMLSLPHYLGSSLPWPTFIILSLEGLYLLQRRLAVIVFYTIIYSMCVFPSKKETACVCLWQGDCWQHWFTWPSGLASVTFFRGHHLSGCQVFRKETWQPSRCVCVFVSCVRVWLCVISFCIPPSLQVSVCWCLMGGLQKTLPGRCTWSSTRRTAGEGPSLRWRSLL